MVESVQSIESAFLVVRASAAEAMDGDAAAKDRAFQDIFVLNNEIGKLARLSPRTMGRMRELQGWVNLITVALKHGKRKELRDGLTATAKSIRALKKDFSAPP
ncbi:MAG TPA: hypothetical protein VLU99_07525 [Nitrososphaerales archaeon]|nr:hypothetical protein [Nitrososphaerales archaeon]HUK75626.1 hypothetical protein [Nitrososphaerales archaeon]